MLTAIYCTAAGSVFIHMAHEGDATCREVLGDALWDAAEPKHVIVRRERDGGTTLRGDICNLMSVRNIDTSRRRLDLDRGAVPILKLPLTLSKLQNLESLVLRVGGVMYLDI